MFQDKLEPCNADFYVDGSQYFGELIKSFETAISQDHYIYILGWMLDLDFKFRLKGRIGKHTFFRHLMEAAARDVQIRILIWDNPLYVRISKKLIAGRHFLQKHKNVKIVIDRNRHSQKPTKDLIKEIAEYFKANKPKTVSVFEGYQQVESLLTGEKPKNGELDDYLDWSVASEFSAAAHHEKIVLVKGRDGLKAFCGGFDINPNRITQTTEATSPPKATSTGFPVFDTLGTLRATIASVKPASNHDVSCKVDGAPARRILKKFVTRWQNCPEAGQLGHVDQQAEAKMKFGLTGTTYAGVVGTYNPPNSKQKPDRSFRDAYFKVIENAKKFVYIEDQYATNIDVAKALNKRMLRGGLELILIVTQANSETLGDTFMPFVLRTKFKAALTKGLSNEQKEKVIYAVIQKSKQVHGRYQYHTIQHSKVLIADDEIAIVGSANVNQRAFWYDSETSLILFDPMVVKKLRMTLWYDTILEKRTYSKRNLEALDSLPQIIKSDTVLFEKNVKDPVRYKSYLKLHTQPDKPDVDVLIANKVKEYQKYSAYAAFGSLGIISLATILLSPSVRGRLLVPPPAISWAAVVLTFVLLVLVFLAGDEIDDLANDLVDILKKHGLKKGFKDKPFDTLKLEQQELEQVLPPILSLVIERILDPIEIEL